MHDVVIIAQSIAPKCRNSPIAVEGFVIVHRLRNAVRIKRNLITAHRHAKGTCQNEEIYYRPITERHRASLILFPLNSIGRCAAASF